MMEQLRIYRGLRGGSPWTIGQRIRMLVWDWCWLVFCNWTPKPLWRWRNLWLRWFGASVERGVFVHQRARIQMPWNVRLRLCACIGDGANLYALDSIDVGKYVTIAQEAYLCTGTHDFADPAMPLATAPIWIGDNSFVGARGMILPGVRIGERAIIGAGAVVAKNVPDGAICVGNPARIIGESPLKSASAEDPLAPP